MAIRKADTGNCECCDNVDVHVTTMHGNILMCDDCRTREEVAVKIIEDARTIDTRLELKADVFNAETVAFVELEAAINNNPAIPADEKNYTLVKEVAARIAALDAVIFADEAALTAKKQARHALQVNGQIKAGLLRPERRAEFRQLDVNYSPVSPKSPKPAKDKTPKTGKAFEREAVMAASKKYGVPMAQVQSILVRKPGMSADAAARQLAEIMGLIPASN